MTSSFARRTPIAAAGIAPIFYPDTPTIESADAIETRAGADLKEIDFRVPRQGLFRVRGRVIDSQTGQAPMSVDIGISGEALGTFGPNGYNAATGTFEVRNVWPGSYKALAVFSDPARRDSSQPRPQVFKPYRSAPPMLMTLRCGSSLPSPYPDISHLNIAFSPVSESAVPYGTIEVRFWPESRVDPSGSFRVDRVWETSYRVGVHRRVSAHRMSSPLPSAFRERLRIF